MTNNIKLTFLDDFKFFLNSRIPEQEHALVNNAKSISELSNIFHKYYKHQYRIVRGNTVFLSKELEKKCLNNSKLNNNVLHFKYFIETDNYIPIELHHKPLTKFNYDDKKLNYKGFYHLHLRLDEISFYNSHDCSHLTISNNPRINEMLFVYCWRGNVFFLDVDTHDSFPKKSISNTNPYDIETDDSFIDILRNNWSNELTGVFELQGITPNSDLSKDVRSALKQKNVYCYANKYDVFQKDFMTIKFTHEILYYFESAIKAISNDVSNLITNLKSKGFDSITEIGVSFDSELVFNYCIHFKNNNETNGLYIDEINRLCKNYMDNNKFISIDFS